MTHAETDARSVYIVRKHNGRWTLYHQPAGFSGPTRLNSYPSKDRAIFVARLMAGRVEQVIVEN